MKSSNFDLAGMNTKPSKHVEKAAASMNKEPSQRLNVEIPAELHAELKSVTGKRRVKVKDAAVEALTAWLEKNK